jgi:hypothetical protein
VLPTISYFETITGIVMKLTHEGFRVPTMPEEFLEAPFVSAFNASFLPSVSSSVNLVLL